MHTGPSTDPSISPEASPCPTPQGWQAVGSTPLPVLKVQAIRAAEQLAFAQMPSYTLMHTAGTQAATAIVHWCQHQTWAKPLLFVVLAGPGNNGGDACVVATALHSARQAVQLVVINSTNPNTQPTDRQRALQAALDAGLQAHTLEHAQQHWAQWQHTHALCVVDGLLGIGAQQNIKKNASQNNPQSTQQIAKHSPRGSVNQAIQWLQQILPAHPTVPCASPAQTLRQSAVVALDCPSGLNADTGRAVSSYTVCTEEPNPVTLKADLTLSFIACKPGLLWGAGKDLCGQVWVHDLGCQARVEQQPQMQCPAANTWMALLPPRQHAQHKGSFGSVAVLGGCEGMVGAALLAGRTALMLGAGRVALSCHQQTVDPLYPELMFKPWAENQNFATVWLLGPGLGQSPEAMHNLQLALQAWTKHQQHQQQQHPQQQKKPALVLDADALNLLAKHKPPPPWDANQVVMTPHPLEAARLLGCGVADIEADRLQAAQNLAKQYTCTVVLKGAGTVVANPQGLAWVHSTGGPALATAGSGDVLAGAIAAFLAQGCNAWQAANAAVGLHGKAVEALPGYFGAAKVLTASAIAQRMQAFMNASPIR